MTINTIENKDDISIYNGDENHKVWAGSQDNLDGNGIYDVYASSTISRPSRPRQISQPVPVPPPPAKEKNKKRNKKLLGGSKEELYPLMNGKANSVSGTMMKPRGPIPPMQQQPMYIMAHPQTLPNPKFFKQYGNTFSHRPKGKMLIPARPIPPPMVPMPPVIIPTTMTKNKKKNKHEEPIYMPTSRALSPAGSYVMPPDPYLMQQYATMDSQYRKKNKAPSEKSAKLNKKMAQSMNGLDDPNLDESPFNTGIYRKKGHLNERAFSYSIRQEHRSRSYGSLANLKFASPIPNGDDDDIKKEREIMQMVQDLDLSGDEIERSEVPRSLYEGRAGPSGPMIIAGPGMVNGRTHRR